VKEESDVLSQNTSSVVQLCRRESNIKFEVVRCVRHFYQVLNRIDEV
jgi:hypothetical protein